MTDEINSNNQLDILKWHCITHENDGGCFNNCYFQNILGLFGKKKTLPIIRLLLLNEKLRFNEILSQIGGSPKTLTERLRDLENHGLVNREVFNEIPIKVEYSLTTPGKDLDELFESISTWIDKWFTMKIKKRI